MKKQKKFKLGDLRVTSFVTSLEIYDANTIKGGVPNTKGGPGCLEHITQMRCETHGLGCSRTKGGQLECISIEPCPLSRAC